MAITEEVLELIRNKKHKRLNFQKVQGELKYYLQLLKEFSQKYFYVENIKQNTKYLTEKLDLQLHYDVDVDGSVIFGLDRDSVDDVELAILLSDEECEIENISFLSLSNSPEIYTALRKVFENKNSLKSVNLYNVMNELYPDYWKFLQGFINSLEYEHFNLEKLYIDDITFNQLRIISEVSSQPESTLKVLKVGGKFDYKEVVEFLRYLSTLGTTLEKINFVFNSLSDDEEKLLNVKVTELLKYDPPIKVSFVTLTE